MGRFLTPSKIVLLALAQVYTNGLVPWSGTSKVVSVLLSRILLDSSDPLELLRQQNDGLIGYLDEALAGLQSVQPGRTIWDLLLKNIWSIDCADALECFLSDAPSLLCKTRDELLRDRDQGLPTDPPSKIVRTSPLGVFIRKCSHEHVRLQFQDFTALWLDFVAYRMPTKGSFTRKYSQASRSAFDVNLADLEIDLSHPLASIIFRPILENAGVQLKSSSTHDSEKLMEFQVSEMQSERDFQYCDEHYLQVTDFGGRLPNSMKSKLKQMVAAGSAAPKLAHYLNFLDSWRAGDFNSAFDNLHRYFDYTMHSRDRTFYQYALLNLAILQADFGCHEEAIPAMQEAIATARENRDSICLNYCLSWLYHFGRAFPKQMQAIREKGILGNDVDGLNFLKSRAKEAEMWTLLSTSHLSEAKIALQCGDSIAACFENVVKAAHINIVKSMPNSTGPALLMKTTLFSRIGQMHLAQACGDRFLLCHGDESPLEDVLKCVVRQANLLAQMGRFKEAQGALTSLPTNILKVLKYQTYHSTAGLLLQARRLLHRDRLRDAGYIIEKLTSQQPHPEADTSTQVSLLEIELLVRRRDFDDALYKLEALAATTRLENNDVMLKAKLMVVKAQVLAKSDRPLGGFSLTMRAIDMSYKARALPVLWEASIALANILCASYEFAAARDMLDAVLPHVLECLDCDLTGRCYLQLADAQIGLAGIEGSRGKNGTIEEGEKAKQKQKLLMGTGMDLLERAGEQFRWVEDLEGQLEVFAKMSRICQWRGDTGLAIEMADKYVSLKKEYAEDHI